MIPAQGFYQTTGRVERRVLSSQGVEMLARKEQVLIERMQKLGIFEEDLVENFILGSGSGGQKINKTSSCVQLIHEPSGIEIKCQQSRSREKNRVLAREELCKRVEFLIEEEKRKKKFLVEKAKRRNRKPSKGQKERRLKDKRHSSEKKSRRSKLTH